MQSRFLLLNKIICWCLGASVLVAILSLGLSIYMSSLSFSGALMVNVLVIGVTSWVAWQLRAGNHQHLALAAFLCLLQIVSIEFRGIDFGVNLGLMIAVEFSLSSTKWVINLFPALVFALIFYAVRIKTSLIAD